MKLKRILAGTIAVLTLLTVMSGCSSDSSSQEESSDNSSSTEKSTTTTTKKSTTTTSKRTTTTTTTTKKEDVQYLSDVKVQFDEENDYYEVIFGLKDSSGEYISSSGVAEISISDSTDMECFNKQISFSESDFSDWTNNFWDGSRYLCGIIISRSDIDAAYSTRGTLYLNVSGDYYSFEEQVLSITDLPEKEGSVNLPSVPLTLQDESHYSYNQTFTVSEITAESSIAYDGDMSFTFNLTVTLNSKTADTNVSDYVRIGYKLTDSSGIIRDSGTAYTQELAIGETCISDFTIWDLEPNETYTLTLMNAT